MTTIASDTAQPGTRHFWLGMAAYLVPTFPSPSPGISSCSSKAPRARHLRTDPIIVRIGFMIIQASIFSRAFPRLFPRHHNSMLKAACCWGWLAVLVVHDACGRGKTSNVVDLGLCRPRIRLHFSTVPDRRPLDGACASNPRDRPPNDFMSKLHYPQFCALARAAELIGERWTLLIIRELLLGPKRFAIYSITSTE
jgi:hypothetical protein